MAVLEVTYIVKQTLREIRKVTVIGRWLFLRGKIYIKTLLGEIRKNECYTEVAVYEVIILKQHSGKSEK